MVQPNSSIKPMAWIWRNRASHSDLWSGRNVRIKWASWGCTNAWKLRWTPVCHMARGLWWVETYFTPMHKCDAPAGMPCQQYKVPAATLERCQMSILQWQWQRLFIKLLISTLPPACHIYFALICLPMNVFRTFSYIQSTLDKCYTYKR